MKPLIALLALLALPLAWAADPETEAVIKRLGLTEMNLPVAERPGWSKPEVIVVATDSAERLQWLQEAVPDVELRRPGSVTELADVQGLVGSCSAKLLENAPQLNWIQLYSAGVETCISQPAINERNILVTNMQRVSSPEIAEHVMAMLLSFSRGLVWYQAGQKDGKWKPGLAPAGTLWELEGKTLLIVGLGGIGTEVARRADAFGMRVTATRRSSREGPSFVDYVGLSDELDELTAEADVVVNALPLTDETSGLFDADYFQTMKPTAYFINVGRGGSVVTDDLLAALRSGELAGAGLDVTDPEPLPSEHPLWQEPNVIITPHVAARSDLLFDRLWLVVRENLRRYANGEPMLSVVNTRDGY